MHMQSMNIFLAEFGILIICTWFLDVTNKILGTKKLPLIIVPKIFHVLPNCLFHQCLKQVHENAPSEIILT